MHHVEVDVARGGEIMGRFTMLQLRKSVESGAIKSDDHYYDIKSQEWRELGTHPFLAEEFQKVKQSARHPYLGIIRAVIALAALIFACIYFYPESQNNQTSESVVVEKTTPNSSETSKKVQSAVVANSESTSAPGPVAPQARPFEVQAIGIFGKDLFPSLILTMAGLKRKDGSKFGETSMAGVYVPNIRKGDSYEVEISADQFMNVGKKTFTFEEDRAGAILMPEINYEFTALSKVKQTMPFNVKYKVTRNDGQTFEEAQVWRVHQINDCPLSLKQHRVGKDGRLTTEDNWNFPRNTFAGYVNENHPWIDAILAEALNVGVVDLFLGPGDWSDTARIQNELTSIWQALKFRGVTYSNIPTSASEGDAQMQHVRFFEECIGNAQANCIDGTVMLASLYRKIGYDVGIALVPGHAYLVITNGTDVAFALETTMIGTHSFDSAVKTATENDTYSLRQIARMSEEEIRSKKILYINISDARKAGVDPIPFMGKDGVVSSTPPVTFSNPRALVNEDAVTTETEQYLNSNGVLSARQFGSRIEKLSREIFDKANNLDKQAQLRRKAKAYRLVEEMEAAALSLTAGGGSTSERVGTALLDCIKEAESDRRAFLGQKSMPILFQTGNRVTDAELADIYEASVRILSDNPLEITSNPDMQAATKALMVSKALRDVAELPLKYTR